MNKPKKWMNKTNKLINVKMNKLMNVPKIKEIMNKNNEQTNKENKWMKEHMNEQKTNNMN